MFELLCSSAFFFPFVCFLLSSLLGELITYVIFRFLLGRDVTI